jgi:ubiquitin C-terminal hydrolase
MTRVLCAEQITDPNLNTTSQDTLFIVEIGVNTQPKLIFEKGSPSNTEITATTGAKYYKITAREDPHATESKVQAATTVSAAVVAPVPTDNVCGLTNPSSMCYLNSAIQLLLDIPEIPEYFFNKKPDEQIKYAIGPQCKTMPTVTQQNESNRNIKLLQHIFNTIKIDSAKTPKTATDIIKIKTQDTPQTAAPSAENTAYYELAKSNADAFLNDQAMLKEIVLANPAAYPDVTPANVDKFIKDEIAPLEKKYSQADPGEFLSALFFPNFLCVDDPKNFTKIIGLNESSEIVCENNTKYDTASVYSPIIELRTDKTNKTISDLLEKHKEIEQIDGKSAQCKTDIDPNEKQKTKQIKHTLQQADTKYIILYLNRNMYDKSTGQQEKNFTKIDTTNEITIDNIQFRIKGCIFHVGPAGGGHYVYGSYDKAGNPNHVRDDAAIIQYPNGIAPKVFAQDGYESTLCLYERIEPQPSTQTQPTIGGSTKTKKRKHKNKKRKTQYKNRK